MDQVMEAAIELPRHYIEIGGSLVHGGPERLFFNDTRFLSWYDLRFDGERPLLLGSVIEDDNATLSVGLANPDICADDTIILPRGAIAIERTKFLWQAIYYERIGFRSYTGSSIRFRIDIAFNADFHDLFEVRGTAREKRGTCTAAVTKDHNTAISASILCSADRY
jgi:glycogen debranching enzyme